MWCLVLTSPCCCGPCETRITTGAKVEEKYLYQMRRISISYPRADHFHLQHHPLVLLSRPLHTAAHVGESWRRIFCHLQTMIVNNIILLQFTY